jgi:hypothetical protein
VFNTAANQYDHAVMNVANVAKLDLSATFKPFANGTSLGQQAGATSAAMDQSMSGLEQARDIRLALAKQLDASQNSGPSAMMGGGADFSGGPNLKSEILSGGVALAVGAINPAAGAAIAAGSALIGAAKWALSSPSAGQHAGTLHAAVDNVATSFKDYGSADVAGEGGHYVDALGDSWHADGTAVGKGITTPANPVLKPLDPRLMLAAGLVIDEMGADRVREDLMFASHAEKRLEQQAGAAMQHQRKVLMPSLDM